MRKASTQNLERPWKFRGMRLGVTSLWVGVLLALPVFSQGGRIRQHREARAIQRADNSVPRAVRAQRPSFTERLHDLPPDEQNRVLANDKRFQSLPPQRQEKIRENLRRWNSLSPEKKNQIRERQEIFSRLSPAQRQQARSLYPQWRQLRPVQRQKIMRAFLRMRAMSPQARQRFLSSPQVQKRFSPDEQNMLEGLGRLLPDSDDQGK